MITEYEKLKINGLCYVREVKDEKVIKTNKGSKVELVPKGYLVIDNKNKPIKNAYFFIMFRIKEGDALNTLKRKCYDLCYFFDFLQINKIDEELLDYAYLFNFTKEYLRRLDKSIGLRDCIQRSMLKNIPVLSQYSNEKVVAFDKNKIGATRNKNKKDKALSNSTFVKILTTVKEYLIWLYIYRSIDVDLDSIFSVVNKPAMKRGNDSLLSHVHYTEAIKVYSITGLLKNAKIPYQNLRETPVEKNMVFEHKEATAFFNELNTGGYNPSYQLLFYLLAMTGLRIAEALALKISNSLDFRNFNFLTNESDIYKESEDSNVWTIKIKVRDENPPDLSIKYNKERTIRVLDNTQTLYNLMKAHIMHRSFLLRKKRLNHSNHDFLFTNAYGNRLKYQVTKQTFDEILEKANLFRDELVIHSFRHTFASEWIRVNKVKKQDVSLLALSQYLGHAYVATTQKTYIHFFEEEQVGLLGKIEDSMHETLSGGDSK